MRYILLFLLGLLGIWWLRRLVNGESGRAQSGAAPRAPAPSERIAGCAHCGLHVPESEGVSEGGHFYCSEAHRRLGPRG
ncbi:PP0621 family protein [Niveibacterium umoris]|uniref:Deaminase n=1 Tax=Niveibacterium umoris TaxID=1193620 RepID=A0A840BT69_9RHOO|nr:uncharacterized protein [Niveibacterium umoris]